MTRSKSASVTFRAGALACLWGRQAPCPAWPSRRLAGTRSLSSRRPRANHGPEKWGPCGAARDGHSWDFCGAAQRLTQPWRQVPVTVIGAASAGAAGAGAVAGQHLGGGPAVEFHQVSLGAAAVQPGVTEVLPEPVRIGVHAALAAAAGDQLADPGGGQRLPVAGPEPQLGPAGLGVPGPGPQVPVQAAG